MSAPGPLIRVRRQHPIRVECEGSEVALLVDGRLVLRAHHRQVEHLAKALLEACARARLLTPRPRG